MTLHCIKCGDEAALTLNLADGDSITCPDCEGEFTVEDVETMIGEWQQAIAWIKTMPKGE
jgi:hypothetical protein